MDQTLLDLGNMCDRVAGKLYDQPVDTDGLADIATTLVLVNHELRRWMSMAGANWGKSRRSQASGMAMAAIDRHLLRLGDSRDCASDEVMRCVIDKALHLMVRVVSVLQSGVVAERAAT